MEQFDLVAIARPFVDVIAEVDDQFLKSCDVRKGGLVEVSTRDLMALRSEITNYKILPGGSLSNTAAGLAALGAKTVFLGKLCNDAGGRVFRNAFHHGGIFFPNKDYPDKPGAITATCLVLVTPDGEGTVIYSVGIADQLNDEDLFPDIIASARMVFIEAHFLIKPESHKIYSAIEVSKSARRPVAFALHAIGLNDDQRKIMLNHYKDAEIMIGNRREFKALFGETEISSFRDNKTLMVMTDAENGVFLSGHDEYHHIPPHRLGSKPNTVGAGDQFAAGFLFGYLNGLPIERCGVLGSETADEILEVEGARPIGSWQHIAERYAVEFPAVKRSNANL